MMRVEHADHQQDGGGVRWAAFLKTRTEDRTIIHRQEDRILIQKRGSKQGVILESDWEMKVGFGKVTVEDLKK